ncbi:MAG: hypothetical protein ACI35Q_02865 [Marinilabiliaceae bacterium]
MSPFLSRRKFSRKAETIVGTAVCIACLAYFAASFAGRWGGVGDSLWLIASRPWLIVAEAVLMLVGVAVETLRWSILRRGFMGGSLVADCLATLRSIALGNSTPFNLGEHVGRGMSYPRRRIAAAVSLLASVVQTAAILALGFAGGLAVRSLGMSLPRAGGVAACAALVAAGFGLAMAWRRRGRRLRAMAAVGWAFAVSTAKVALFSFQLFLLLAACGGASGGLYCAVLFYYLCVTVTPRVNLFDIGVKGMWAAGIFAPWVGEEGAVAATVVLWLINIVAPSCAGYVVLIAGRQRRTTA